jgi:hypothetical protein
MATDLEELKYSLMTRIAGEEENAAMDVQVECGQNRAQVSSLERGAALIHGAVSVSTTAVAMRVGAGNATNRRSILIQNQGPLSVYIGGASVTTANGYELALKAGVEFAIGESQTLYAIAASGTQNVRVLEVYDV